MRSLLQVLAAGAIAILILGISLAALAASPSLRNVPPDSEAYRIADSLATWEGTAQSGFSILSQYELQAKLEEARGSPENEGEPRDERATRLADLALSAVALPHGYEIGVPVRTELLAEAMGKLGLDLPGFLPSSGMLLPRLTLSFGDLLVYDVGGRYHTQFTSGSGLMHMREDVYIVGNPTISLHVLEEVGLEWGRGRFGKLELSTSQHDPFLVGSQERYGLNPEMNTVSLKLRLPKVNATFLTGDVTTTYLNGPFFQSPVPGTSFLSGLRIELNPSPNLSVGIGDTVITTHPYALGLLVTDPLQYFGMLSGSTQGNQQVDSNLIGFVDAEYVSNKTRYYGEFIWDSTLDPADAAIQGTVGGPKTGLLLGVARALSPERLVRVEYVSLDPTVYTFHRNPKFEYSFKGVYMGHWAGPDAKNLILSVEEASVSNRLSLVALQLESRGDLSPKGPGGGAVLHASQSGALDERTSFQWAVSLPLSGDVAEPKARLGLIVKVL